MSAALRFGWLALMAACSGSCSSPGSQPEGGATTPPSWQVVLHDMTPTFLCVWGTAADDVFAVGGPLSDGTPTAALHYDGKIWTDLHPSGTTTFWWTNGVSSKDVWMVGEQGRMTHWDGSRLTESTPLTAATLYGVWAGASNDVWAVGGIPEGGTAKPNDVLLHYDGHAWSAVPVPQPLGRTFFKVWGTASDNLYVVGELGTIWHRKGTTWSLEANSPPLATGNLTSVFGCSATEVYAVGGEDVLVSDGKTWTRAKVSLENGVNGVSCASPGKPVIVGFGGLKQRLVDGHWQSDFSSEPHSDLHGAWADPSGGFWAAGGAFVNDPMQGASRAGVIGYYGSSNIGSTVQ